jgi:hypothetical protein
MRYAPIRGVVFLLSCLIVTGAGVVRGGSFGFDSLRELIEERRVPSVEGLIPRGKIPLARWLSERRYRERQASTTVPSPTERRTLIRSELARFNMGALPASKVV